MQDATRIRIQMELSGDAADSLQALAAAGGFRSRTELVNNGLALLQWAFDQVGKGRVVAAVDDETRQYVELAMPCLEFVRSQRQFR